MPLYKCKPCKREELKDCMDDMKNMYPESSDIYDDIETKLNITGLNLRKQYREYRFTTTNKYQFDDECCGYSFNNSNMTMLYKVPTRRRK